MPSEGDVIEKSTIFVSHEALFGKFVSHPSVWFSASHRMWFMWFKSHIFLRLKIEKTFKSHIFLWWKIRKIKKIIEILRLNLFKKGFSREQNRLKKRLVEGRMLFLWELIALRLQTSPMIFLRKGKGGVMKVGVYYY